MVGVGGRTASWNRRRLQGIYESLRGFGLERDDVEQVMRLLIEQPGESEAAGLSACLDWLCLHVSNEVPTSLLPLRC